MFLSVFGGTLIECKILCGISKDKASMDASKHFILRNTSCCFFFFFFLNYTQWAPTLYLLDITRMSLNAEFQHFILRYNNFSLLWGYH